MITRDELPWVTKVYKRDLDYKRYNVPFLLNPYLSFYTSRGCPALRLVRRVYAPTLDQFMRARGLVLGNPLADQIRARGQDPSDFAARIEDGLRAAYGASPTRMPMQTILFEATRP